MTNTYLTEDLSTGHALRVVALRVLDGIAGWAVAVAHDGSLWAYAPQDVVLNTGEICREV